MSVRKHRRELAPWEADTRRRATDSADPPIALRTGQPRQDDQPPQLRIDLPSGHENVQLDICGASAPVAWTGPAAAPLEVVAVYHLHVPAALLDHPGLNPLRSPSATGGQFSCGRDVNADERPGSSVSATAGTDHLHPLVRASRFHR